MIAFSAPTERLSMAGMAHRQECPCYPASALPKMEFLPVENFGWDL
jgi:hypothetical protein